MWAPRAIHIYLLSCFVVTISHGGLLETRSKFGAYSKTHKLQKLLEEIIANTAFRTDKTKYFMALQVITVCTEEYRYNFLLDNEGYKQSVQICDQLLEELIQFENEPFENCANNK